MLPLNLRLRRINHGGAIQRSYPLAWRVRYDVIPRSAVELKYGSSVISASFISFDFRDQNWCRARMTACRPC